jgi:circadian clock protein KaiC
MEISSLADVRITLRYVERAGEFQRVIAVLHARGSAHDHTIRLFTIDRTGMHIGEPLSAIPSTDSDVASKPPWRPGPEATPGPSE